MTKKIQWMTLFFAVIMLMTALVFATDPEMETEVLRVGYVINSGTINAPIINGSEGYGYEYLHKIMEYTDHHYDLEFVKCQWEDAYKMLDAGEIDLFGPCNLTADMEKQYLYTQSSFGDNLLFLCSKGGDSAQIQAVDGSRIGIQKGRANEAQLSEFLEENGWSANIVYMGDGDAAQVMDYLNLDYCVTTAMEASDDLKVVAQLGANPVYYVTRLGNDKLMDDINKSMATIENKEYMYQERLFLKYYDYEISGHSYVTDEEYALLQEQDAYYVGVQNLSGPLSQRDSNGQLCGVIFDAMDMIEEMAGIQIVEVEITDGDLLEKLDFYTLVSPENMPKGTRESTSYMEIPFLILERVVEEGQYNQTIGTLAYYGIEEVILKDHLYGRQMYTYENVEQLRKAYDQGEIDSMLITSASLNYVRREFEDASFMTTPLNVDMVLTLNFNESISDEKIEIFNKILRNLDETALNYSLLRNSAEKVVTYDAATFLRDNPEVIIALIGLIGFLVFYYERKRRRALTKVIEIDQLTGLYSLHKFKTEATKWIKNNPHVTYALLSLDIDNFKYINEIYGYEMGSNILKQLSRHMLSNLSKDALLCRSYGDNFLFLVHADEVEKNIEVSSQESNPIYSQLNQYLGETYHFSFSIGVYKITDPSLEFNYMIDCTNLARQMGKKYSRTTVNVFSEDILDERAANNDIVASMDDAISGQEFILFYQPKIDLRTKEMTGAEALVRWVRGDRFIPPNDFIPLFEKNGFIETLDFYVLNQVCAFLAKHSEVEVPKISVNLSGLTINQPDVVERVAAVLERHGISTDRIDVEITETAFVDEFETATKSIDALRKIGITISMDDFGAGISSLNRLKNITIDTLKIDREFIVDYLENEKGSNILRNMLIMAKDLNLETVAEGIETKEQADFLQNYGCDVGQGYFYARPMSEADFLVKCKAKQSRMEQQGLRL